MRRIICVSFLFLCFGFSTLSVFAQSGTITTYAGNGTEAFGGDDGLGTSAAFDSPNGVAVDAVGNLFIADYYNSRVRKVTPDGVIRTVAGNGEYGLSVDGGPATSARLAYPTGGEV